MLAEGTTLGPYRILAPLGAGGMGEVYRARDTRLGRDVAIKVLSPHLAATPEVRARFEREARTISQLNHPHICTLHDVGHQDGIDYLVMELLEGETLAHRLEKGPLPVADVLRVGGQIATALDAAHRAGVVHRDLKPGNVMLTGGGAKLMDFGLARGVPAEGGSGLGPVAGALSESPTVSRPLTKEGTIVGTIHYMAPEQLEGKEADVRSDIWALGCVLYEMATGKRAFQGESQASLIAAILKEPAQPMTELQPQAPSGLERIANYCLAKNPEERFQSARDLAFALESLGGAAARPTSVAEARPAPSLAVLPFANLSADKENEYFSDGLAEDIIDALTQVPGLRVMARTSAFAFRGKEQDVREIGTRLNVDHLLEGSVRRSGDRLRVTAQLVKASDGYHLWSQRFDREMTDVFAIQDEISQAIVEKLRLRLSGDRPLVKRYTENLAAYDLCLKARYHLMKVTWEEGEACRRYCEQAIALDPNYALAYATLSHSYLWATYWGFMNPQEAFSRAKDAALKALRLDDAIPETHEALGGVLAVGEYDWLGAEREFRRAKELSPSSAIGHYYYGMCFLLPLGRVEQALTETRRVVELDPLDPFYNSILGYVIHVTRQFDSAVAQLQHTIDLDPTFFCPYWYLSITQTLTGRLDEAIAAAERARDLSGGNAITSGWLGRVYGLAGRAAEARRLLEELEVRRRSSYVPASAIAMIHRGLGDLEKALEWWAKGIEEHDQVLVTSLSTEPGYDPLRSLPRYHELLRKMNLEP